MKIIIIIMALLWICSIKAGEYCDDCHDDVLNKKNKHQPALEFCTYCHGTHKENTGKEYNLLSVPNELCILCHYQDYPAHDLAEKHPVNRHPLESDEDPLYPEKPFTCISCHNPHSSDMPYLFRYDCSQPPYSGHVCAVCHWDLYNLPKPQTPPWN